ncbi:MAG: serine hydroxymethyltransferase [Planctomycetota bacterium]|jgi:glycine hydroxymethyltransferase
MLLEGLSSQQYHEAQLDSLKESDGQVYQLLTREYERRRNTLQLGAAENQCSRAVLAALGSVLQNKTAEGFVGARLHGGCEVVDDVEGLAVGRAKEAFGAQYANVQPHSGTQANQIVLTAVLESGDKILSMALEQGGHYSHGSRVSFTGRFFEVENYYVDKESLVLDYDAIREQALKFKPKLIICGASAYTRTIDFEKFREIADEVGAYLLADVSHISGLVIAGAHPSPVDFAHFTTTSTYKPGGPRGGLILMGKDYGCTIKVGTKEAALWEHIDEVTFPGVQGTPYFNNMAAKAVFFKEAVSDEYKERQFKIVENAKRLAKNLLELGHDVVAGGTDNHMVLVNVANLRQGLTGGTAQKCLEECGIIVDMIHLPYEKGASAAGGIRLGTPIVTRNGMGAKEIDSISALVDAVLKKTELISDGEYKIDESLKEQTQAKVKDLCSKFLMR